MGIETAKNSNLELHKIRQRNVRHHNRNGMSNHRCNQHWATEHKLGTALDKHAKPWDMKCYKREDSRRKFGNVEHWKHGAYPTQEDRTQTWN